MKNLKTSLIAIIILLAYSSAIAQPAPPPNAIRSIAGQIANENSLGDIGADERKKSVANASDRMGKFIGLYKSAKEMYDGIETLKKGECLPDYTVNPEAMVPSFCTDSLGKCAKCYEEAYKKLNDARKRLGRLKCMGLTMKGFVSGCVSFGDNASSIHAIQGLAWQKERKGIMDSYDKFKDAYDKKYKELMDLLNEAMMAINECEDENGQKDWYQRFGFMYVEFMSEKYKRSE